VGSSAHCGAACTAHGPGSTASYASNNRSCTGYSFCDSDGACDLAIGLALNGSVGGQMPTKAGCKVHAVRPFDTGR
jgi:hypothetical protein